MNGLNETQEAVAREKEQEPGRERSCRLSYQEEHPKTPQVGFTHQETWEPTDESETRWQLKDSSGLSAR